MASAGGDCSNVPEQWPLVDCFQCLGNHIQDNGSIRICWTRARSSMWRAFWGNVGSSTAKHLSIDTRLHLIDRAVLPQLEFRCSRWPPQQQIANEISILQQKTFCIALKLPREIGEENIEYVRRRGRIARRTCKQHGLWTSRWFSRAISWDNHLSRGRNSNSWSSRLRDFHAKQWLIEQRQSFFAFESQSSSCLAGRTGTRAVHGRVFMRWHDGIEFAQARTHLQSSAQNA